VSSRRRRRRRSERRTLSEAESPKAYLNTEESSGGLGF
jgi:hypothetical protein